MITIRISDKAWEELNKKKKRGETFEDVIDRLLKLKDKEENGGNKNDKNK